MKTGGDVIKSVNIRLKSVRRTVLAMLLVVLGGGAAMAESTTVEFDFSSNNYGFPEYKEAGDQAIKSGTVITEGDASITLGAWYTAWKAYWKVSEQALCYEDESFIQFTCDNGSKLRSISLEFAGDRKASGNNYFYDWDRKVLQTPYVYDEATNTGKLTVTSEDCAQLVWYCRADDPMNIHKIKIGYETEEDDDISLIRNVSEGKKWSVSGNGGRIAVSGEARSIEIYGINGMLLARNKRELACPAGIYIVRIDGTAQKLIVH